MQFRRGAAFAERIEQCNSLTGLRALLKEILDAQVSEEEFSALFAGLIKRRLELLGESRGKWMHGNHGQGDDAQERG